jgi:hypothetical protein
MGISDMSPLRFRPSGLMVLAAYTLASIGLLGSPHLASAGVIASGLIGYGRPTAWPTTRRPRRTMDLFRPYAPGITGQAFDLSGVDRDTGAGAVSIPDNAAYSFGSDFSVGFWFNVNGSPTPDVFLGQDNGTGLQSKWFIDYGFNPGAFEIHFNGPSFAFLPSDVVALPQGWNQLTLTRSASTFSFYLNGIAIGIRASAARFPIRPTTLRWDGRSRRWATTGFSTR